MTASFKKKKSAQKGTFLSLCHSGFPFGFLSSQKPLLKEAA